MDLATTLALSAKGMTAQSVRLQVIAQNVANSDTTGSTPGADPYRRKMVAFASTLSSMSVTLRTKVTSDPLACSHRRSWS